MVRAGLVVIALLAASVGPLERAAAAEIPASGTLDLRILSDLRLSGDLRGARLGTAVAPAGDVNGDGIDDLVVGAPRHDAGRRTNTGAAWIVFGTLGSDPEPESIAAAQGFRIDGAAPFDTAGAAVAGIGDVNRDGFDDILVGAPLADAGDRKDAGAAYVVLGRAGTEPVDLAAAGSAALVVLGKGRNDRLGSSVAGLPDANGDGRGDLVIGAPRADRPDAADEGDQAYVSEPPLPKNAGAAYVIFTPREPATIDTAAVGAQGYRIEGARGRAGASVTALPDWNGDGIAEIAVGAPLYRRATKPGGRAYVVWGSATATPVDLARLGPRGLLLDGGGRQRAGAVVASVGDVGGDARGDLAVGADQAGRRARRQAGRVLIVYARSEPGSLELEELGDTGLRLDGEDAGDHAGVAIAPAGDVDGDGRDDVLIGAHGADPLQRPDAGAAYVLYGGSGLQSLDLAFVGTRGFRIAGAEAGERLGRSVALAGDPNGDGRTDLALGSPRTAEQSGAVSLVHGARPPVVDPIEELPADPGAAEEAADGCRAVSKIGVIVDDSGSMTEFDPGRLRVAALELLLDKTRNAGERIGAVEFGDAAEQLFPPVLLGSETFERDRRMLGRLIDERVRSDAGSTNYNAAFAGAQTIDPDADAVVFITDGGHNVGRFRALHRDGPPTFVIGVGIGRDGRDGGRLQHIADETDGAYFPDVDATELQAVLNRIDAGLNCDTDIATATDRVGDHDAPEPIDEPLGDGTHSADVVVSWDDPLDDIELHALTVIAGGKRVARFGADSLRRATAPDRVPQRNGVSVDGTAGQTYLSLRLNGVRRGRIHLRFAGADLHGDSRERVVTQITESRRRR